MAFPDAFLDELRHALPVSTVVGRRHQLIKAGAEFKAKDDPSLTVNDHKRLWHDFGKGDDGGDIFDWFVKHEGLDFPEAVEECAKIAGVPLPTNGDGRRTRAPAPAPASHDVPWDDGAPPAVPDDHRASPVQARMEIVETYDYCDPQGGDLLYQTCRAQFRLPDGSWELGKSGKTKKTFMQRRPSPAGDGSWILSIKDGDFIRSRSGDWLVATKERIEKWHGAERRTFGGGVEHTLYRLMEFGEEKSTGEPVYLPEGERKVDLLRSWGLAATSNSGGAGNWRPDHAEMFRGLDVVVLIDNDEAGVKRGDKICRSLRGIAKRVRLLNFADVWPDAPQGADVVDWKREREGSAEELREIVERLPEWAPARHNFRFGRLAWSQQDAPGLEYEWVVKGILPMRQEFAIVGPSQSGKSFEAFNLAAHIAVGWDYRGARTKRGLVVYCMPEGGAGAADRMRALRLAHGLPLEGIPFEVLKHPFDIFTAETDLAALIPDIRALVDAWPQYDLRAIFIDTWSAMAPGLKENASEDISRVRGRLRRLRDEFSCSVGFIHHMNAAGDKVRGHTSIVADIETVLTVSRVMRTENKAQVEVTDDHKRPLRRITVTKQREGVDGKHWDFVLRSVEVRTDADGDRVSSCISEKPADGAQGDERAGAQSGDLVLNDERTSILQALKSALDEFGEPPPRSLRLPGSISKVVHSKKWKEAYLRIAADAEAAPDNTINTRLRRASEKFQSERVIGRENPWVWITGRPVRRVIGPSGRDENPFPGRAEPRRSNVVLDDDDLPFG